MEEFFTINNTLITGQDPIKLFLRRHAAHKKEWFFNLDDSMQDVGK